MPTTARSTPSDQRLDPRVDAYLAEAAGFARPILTTLRAIVHEACPAVEEDIKWGMPFFVYRGPLCNLAAFKAHCAFGFWRARELPELPKPESDAMGSLGRITSVDDLPPTVELVRLIEAAMRLNEADRPKRESSPKPSLEMPVELLDALARRPDALQRFEAFGPGARREYIEWIAEAKRDETRAARVATAVEWIGEGKTRNWKYR